MIRLAKPYFGIEEETAVINVLKSGIVAAGPRVKKFEEDIAEYVTQSQGVAVSSGTAALHCALHCLNLSPGDEVITTPFTFIATINAILFCGAKPILVDVDEETYNINPKLIEKKITAKTKAIITVDLFGQACDYEQIQKIARDKNLILIEDACQAIGAKYQGKNAGSLGDIGVFSFYATKNITCGEGGMLVTNNAAFAQKAREFRNHGQKEAQRYNYLSLGYNYRMTDIEAALGIEQLKKIELFIAQRISNANLLSNELSKLSPDKIKLPIVKEENKHVFHQYTIRTASQIRDNLVAQLKEKEIEAGIFYPKPLHLYDHIRLLGYKEGDFPVAEKCAKEVISLPIHPQVTNEEIKYVAKCIRDFYEKN